MRILRKTIVLALAAFGAYRAWELLSVKLDMTRDRVAPAWSNGNESAEEASRDTAASLSNASGRSRLA